MIRAVTELDLDRGLARLGYQTFRPGQREAIRALLDFGRLLQVAPTGGGKSLTYQLPASLLPGTTLVISPLVSLMHDQVQALEAREILENMGGRSTAGYFVLFFPQLFIGALFAAIGGMLAAAYYKKEVPPALGGTWVPPVPPQ